MYNPYSMPLYNRLGMSPSYLRTYNDCNSYCQEPSTWKNRYVLLKLINGCYMFVFVKGIDEYNLICKALCYDYNPDDPRNPDDPDDPDDRATCDPKKCHGRFKDCVLVKIRDICFAKVFLTSCDCSLNKCPVKQLK
ncbi:hypothetical protein [Wukongibacter baidiensis]